MCDSGSSCARPAGSRGMCMEKVAVAGFGPHRWRVVLWVAGEVSGPACIRAGAAGPSRGGGVGRDGAVVAVTQVVGLCMLLLLGTPAGFAGVGLAPVSCRWRGVVRNGGGACRGGRQRRMWRCAGWRGWLG